MLSWVFFFELNLYIRYVKKLIFIFLLSNVFAGSLDNSTVSFHQLYSFLLSNETTPINEKSVGNAPAYYAINGFSTLYNIKFEFVRSTDEAWDKRFNNGGDRLYVKKGLAFSHCTFPEVYWLVPRNMVFEECISFVQSSNLQIVFKDCIFRGPFLMRIGTRAKFLKFINCTFERGFSMMEGAAVEEYLSFENCTFKYNEQFILNPRVNKSQFNIGSLVECPYYFYIGENKEEFDLRFTNCNFYPVHATHPKYKFYIDLTHSYFKSLEVSGSKFSTPLDLSFVTISNQFKIYESTLDGIIAEALNFNSSNSKIDWENLSEKIIIKTVDGKFLNGLDVAKANNKNYFETLISVYALLYNTYKQQGNKLSANQCYVEWKNIETNYLYYNKKTNPTMTIWFSWFMNAFLKFFCDYGTNPFKSLLISFYVLALFGVIYFIIFWNYDTTEHKDVRFVFKSFGKYFTDDFSLLDVGQYIYKEKPLSESKQQIRTYLYTNKNKLPYLYRLMGKILTRKEIKWGNLIFYKIFNSFFGKWNTKKGFKKTIIISLSSLWIVYLLTKIIFIRIADAFTFSLNSFSTLGYGDLPQNETMRYLSIIEGFIGWFLLSIFSVALISQIIQ